MPTASTSAAPPRAPWRFARALAIAALTIAAAACSKSDSQAGSSGTPAGGTTATTTTTTTTATAGGGAAAAAKAKEVFDTRCVPCHGPQGKGDGPASPSLQPPPRNFSDPAWQASVEDSYLETIIKMGGAAVGKSPTMPSNPDLNDPAVLTALKDHVRSLGATN